MKLTRLTLRGHDVGIKVSIAATAKERMRGLLGRDSLHCDEALLLHPCRSIHTFGMRFAIDVLFLDRHRRVATLHHDVPRRRVLFNLRATQTLELPSGTARRHGIAVGDQLAFEAIR
jgi:uncharacterized membrane protein (UPF0127 family)